MYDNCFQLQDITARMAVRVCPVLNLGQTLQQPLQGLVWLFGYHRSSFALRSKSCPEVKETRDAVILVCLHGYRLHGYMHALHPAVFSRGGNHIDWEV